MKKTISFLLKVAISGLLLQFALSTTDFSALWLRIAAIHPSWALTALVAITAQTLLVGTRWSYIAENSGSPLRKLDAIRFTYIGMFFNQTLPSTIGGDAARIWFFAHAGGSWRGAVHSVLIDRGAGLIWLALIVLTTLPWSFQIIQNQAGRITLTAIGAAGVLGPAGLFFIATTMRQILERWRLTRQLLELIDLLRITLLQPQLGGAVAGLSIAVHLLSVLATWLIAQSIGSSLTFAQSLFLTPPITLISAIPISIAGWGVREGAMVAAFTYAGLSAADGLTISVLLGAGLFITGGIGAGLWMADRKR